MKTYCRNTLCRSSRQLSSTTITTTLTQEEMTDRTWTWVKLSVMLSTVDSRLRIGLQERKEVCLQFLLENLIDVLLLSASLAPKVAVGLCGKGSPGLVCVYASSMYIPLISRIWPMVDISLQCIYSPRDTKCACHKDTTADATRENTLRKWPSKRVAPL